jgi:murein DD-endopeptidase MepM/ murein hydrolase activator NlpD
MKNTFLFLLSLCFIVTSNAQDKKNFSGMEVNHIRVSTPGLYDNDNQLHWHFENFTEKDYAFPLPGAKVISPYGGRRRSHSGIDIKTRPNDTIYAAFSGVVRMSKPYSGYGKVIVIRHDNGLETVYSHNSKNFVKSGEIVKVGQPIALTGRSGRATTAHLHFETRVNGQHFNPNIIFNFKDGTLRKEHVKCTKNGRGVIVKVDKKKD